MLGGYTCTGYSFLTMLITSRGFSTANAAFITMISGLVVLGSKNLFGFIADRVDTSKTNYLFGFLTFAGLVMLQFTGKNFALLFISILIYSSGLGMSTVGLVTWAKELSSSQTFEKNNQLFQIGYAAGSMIFSVMPGILADASNGDYLISYGIFAVFVAVLIFVIQVLYKRAKR